MKNQNNQLGWYREKAQVFNDFYLREVEGLVSSQRTRQEVDFIENLLELRRASKILDLACGHGRHSLELAKRGYQVIGIDINRYFLELAKKEADRNNLKNVKFINKDIRKINYKNEYNTVIMLFNSFGYFQKEADNQKVLNNVYQCLKPSGKFILDIDNQLKYQRQKTKEIYQKINNNEATRYLIKYNTKTKRLNQKRMRYQKEQLIQELIVSTRLYSLKELKAMLKSVGLDFVVAYGNYCREPANNNSSRVIIIAKKLK